MCTDEGFLQALHMACLYSYFGSANVDHIKVMFTYMGSGSGGSTNFDHVKVMFTYMGSGSVGGS